MTILVWVASAADIDDIVRLNRDVQLLHAELEPSFFKSNFDNEMVAAFFAAKLAVSEHHIRLADSGDGPNGYVWFEVQDRPETPLTLARKRIYIHHLSVRAGARRHGIASALLRQVEAEALIGSIKGGKLQVPNRQLKKAYDTRKALELTIDPEIVTTLQARLRGLRDQRRQVEGI